MLSAVTSKWITILAGVIAAVVLVSVAIGLASPDGSVGDQPTTAAGSPFPSKAATTTPAPPAKTKEPTQAVAALAPASLSKPWPGRPRATKVKDDDVDWCPAVRTEGANEAIAIFGQKSVDAAACAAVRFVFEQRYSRLSLPRRSYDAEDFDFVLPALTSSTAREIYRPRVDSFIAHPDNRSTREALGLVLLRGEGTPAGAKHASAGQGRVFYGKAYSTRGYRDRAAWINPTWSKVTIRVDRSKADPRIVASLNASAAMPVFNPAEKRADMLTVPTTSTFFLRHEGGTTWKVGGWNIHTGASEYAKLTVN